MLINWRQVDEPKIDLSAEETIAEIRKFLSDQADSKMCILVIMSHGVKGHFQGSDGRTVRDGDIVQVSISTTFMQSFYVSTCADPKSVKIQSSCIVLHYWDLGV